MVDEAMLGFVREYIERRDPLATTPRYRYPFRQLFGHCFRVCTWAGRICDREGGDREVIEPAALFHDVGKCVDVSKAGHAAASARICGEYLQSTGCDPARADRIVAIVGDHIHHCREGDDSPEARIVSDADLLDEMGAVTVLWDCVGMPEQQRCSYNAAYEKICGHYEQYVRDGRKLLTAAGTDFLNERIESLGQFVRHLEFELGLSESCASCETGE